MGKDIHALPTLFHFFRVKAAYQSHVFSLEINKSLGHIFLDTCYVCI